MIQASAVKGDAHYAMVVFSGLDKDLVDLLVELQVASHLYTKLSRSIALDTVGETKRQLEVWARHD